MVYLNQMSSLEDKATVQVAINLCQDNSFKEEALCFEKPTYGYFSELPSWILVSDSKNLSIWSNIKETEMGQDDHSYDHIDPCHAAFFKIKEWDLTLEEQCQRLTEDLPRSLKHGVHGCIHRIALEYLSYSRRQELFFGVSRYFLMDVLTREDWTEVSRLDEKKLAERLIKDERLTVFQRYRIACAYCLHENIPQLWKRLHKEEKMSVCEDNIYGESHLLVLLWSKHMDGEKLSRRNKKIPWRNAAELAMYYGNRTALMSCWKMLKEKTRQEMVIDMAVKSFEQWRSTNPGLHEKNKDTLLLNDSPSTQSHKHFKHYNLPSHYSELIRVFLSEMDEEQLLIFFKKALARSPRNEILCRNFGSVLDCFLCWPLQEDFLPMMNRLWGKIPPKMYEQCLLNLADMYGGNHGKKNRCYDYRSLLWALWEETPEVYKQYVFRDKKHDMNESTVLLRRLVERSPFQRKDEALFKAVLNDQPPEERRAMMGSELGISICLILTEKEKWSFTNWLLEECFPKEEIPGFKKDFIHSYRGLELCCFKITSNCEKFVEDLIEWCFSLDAEKMHFRLELVRNSNFLNACKTLLREKKFSEVERMINFCSFSNEMKDESKVRIASYTCSAFLNDIDYLWEQMDAILAWSVDAEEKVRDLKKDLFSDVGFHIHYQLVCMFYRYEDAECFYKWFDLSPEEIKRLKKDTAFSCKFIEYMESDSFDDKYHFLDTLLWCLTDEEMVVEFEKYVQMKCFDKVLDKKEKEAKEKFDFIVGELNSFNREQFLKFACRSCFSGT